MRTEATVTVGWYGCIATATGARHCALHGGMWVCKAV